MPAGYMTRSPQRARFSNTGVEISASLASQQKSRPDRDGSFIHVSVTPAGLTHQPNLVELDVGNSRLAAALVDLGVERNLLAFRETVDAGALKSGCVNENVLVAVVWCDKAVAFLVVVEFYSAAFHGESSSKLRFVGADATDAACRQ